MRIANLKLRNWLSYRGTHEIDLGAKTYAIVARRTNDPDASNWSGKSAMMESVRFALYGVHRHRLDEGWISHSESAGEVQLTLDDGTIIRRTKVVGKAGRLYVQEPGVSVDKAAVQDEAQAIILRRVGIGDDDFVATCYFEQKRMSRLITAKPEERMSIVAAWLDLDPLIRAEDFARAHAAKLGDEVAAIDAAVLVQEGIAKEYTGTDSVPLTGFTVAIAEATSRMVDAEHVHDAALAAYEAAHEVVRKFDCADRFVIVRAEGIVLSEEIEALEARTVDSADVAKLQESMRIVTESAAVDREKLVAQRTIAKGQFDGTCPIAPIDCPARAAINKLRRGAREECDKLEQRSTALSLRADGMQEDIDAAQHAEVELASMRARLERLTEEARLLQGDKRAVKGMERPDVEGARAALEEARQAVGAAKGAVDYLRQRAAGVEKANREVVRLRTARLGVAEKLGTAREALVILGKQGAQRRVAEGALGAIEAGANDLLVTAGIDLKVSVLWSREGRGLADHCAECGHPFPASTKVKECARCAAVRGPKQVNKLEIELSDRSGAAEDLAGIALQLSASAWLRVSRSIPWSVALIDEPFSACDRARRSALATHLTVMLSSYGMDQAFIVAHDAQSVDALPGRIEIVSDGKRVVSLGAS